MLGEIEGALYRAEEEIGQWVKGTPDPDTQATLDDLDGAGRAVRQLRYHLEKADPWAALAQAETTLADPDVAAAKGYVPFAKQSVFAAMDAHRRFQLD